VPPVDAIVFLADVSPAAWIADRLTSFARDTGSVVPPGFEAYCRIFHPVDGERWHDIAARNGRIAHPEMQLRAIDHPPGTPQPRGDHQVADGWLPMPERSILAELLRPFTTTPDRCWFAIWEGFGGLDDQGVAARVELPQRRYLLYAGPVELVRVPGPGVEPFDQSANLWWPDDLAWVVATEIDFAWTYVGGTRALVEALLSDGRIEALPAQLTDKPFVDSDLVNAALDLD
jgi:hypothetical protein